MAAEQPTPKVIWTPSAKQRALLSCPVFEVFFGGSRGGGKTDAMIGEWAQHSSRYGADAIGLMIRRTAKQLGETFERARVLYSPLGAKLVGSPESGGMRIIMPNGARLTFGHLERDSDAEAYQGSSYCVAVGTLVRMADGGLKPIEAIAPGEMVETLEGPRRVTDTTKPYQAACVRALVRDGNGVFLGYQDHPVWHPVLTSAGLTSGRIRQKHQTAGRPDRQASARCGGAAAPRRDVDPVSRAWLAYSRDGKTGYRSSSDGAGESGTLQPLCVPVVLHEPSVLLAQPPFHAVREKATQYRSRGKSEPLTRSLSQALTWGLMGLRRLSLLAQSTLGLCARAPGDGRAYAQPDWQIGEGYQGSCLAGRGFYDGCAHTASETVRWSAQQPVGAEGPSRIEPWGVSGTTRIRIHQPQRWWVHPYTGEARRLRERVTIGTMEVAPIGLAFVADLTVADANHYITETGLVNKNTRVYVEEVGNFPSPAPIMKLFATLRSGANIPCRIRLTGNPGGPGHQWVKARYIDPAPLGWQVITDEVTGLQRVFIPSKVVDNPMIGANYVSNLQASGNPELVKAWLEGDWTVTAGAYFPEFDSARHIIAPCELPPHWTRIRAFDWGSARPFCNLWLAVSDGTGQFPTNALIVYREWYGSTGEPNVGIRLPAEAVGFGILERELPGERIALSVCDPAMMKEDGGPSMAERMRGIPWHGADNSRITGWDQVRARLRGIDGKPALYIFSTCTDLIRTLPALQHDTHKPEDLDSSGEDHSADALRYGSMARPWTTPPPVKARVDDTWARSFARSYGDDDENSWKVA